MAENSKSHDRSMGERMKHTVESKVLVPLAATVVSAAASYLAKKLPILIEERLLPKLREQGGTQGLVDALVGKASDLGERAGQVVPAKDDGAAEKPSSNGSARSDMSNEEREEQRRQREERRRARQRSVGRAA